MIDSTTETRLLSSHSELQQAFAESRGWAQTIGLVPTMGALHEGHLSLVKSAQQQCDVTFVSIFVNPCQFATHEDLDQYPRTLERDLARLSELKVAYAFAPPESEIYPPGFSTFVEPPAISAELEGACRPGHFRGVATVVLKLFQLIPADIAYFGEKDYQQCLVVRRMVTDLNVPLTVRTCPIIRAADGLALSSRNRYLDQGQRLQALALSRSLRVAQEMVAQGRRDTAEITASLEQILRQAGITRVDYVAIRDAETLKPLPCVDRPSRVLLAAYVGETRLIDNCALG